MSMVRSVHVFPLPKQGTCQIAVRPRIASNAPLVGSGTGRGRLVTGWGRIPMPPFLGSGRSPWIPFLRFWWIANRTFFLLVLVASATSIICHCWCVQGEHCSTVSKPARGLDVRRNDLLPPRDLAPKRLDVRTDACALDHVVLGHFDKLGKMPPKSNVSDGGEKEEKVSWLRKLACCFPQKSKKKDQKDVPRASKAPAAAEETAKLTSTAAATTSRTKDAGVEAMRKEEEDVAKFSSVGVEVRKLEEQFKYANKASGADEPAISDDEAKSMPDVPTTVMSSGSEPSQRDAKALSPALEAESEATKSAKGSAKREGSQSSSKAAKVTGAVGGSAAAVIGCVAAAMAGAKSIQNRTRHGKHHVLWGQVRRAPWPWIVRPMRSRNLGRDSSLPMQSSNVADHNSIAVFCLLAPFTSTELVPHL